MADSPINVNLDTSGVETKFPSLNVGEYKASVAKIEPVESSNKPGLYMLKTTLALQEPATSTDGRPINPGFEFIHNITLPLAPGHADYKAENDDPQTGIRIRSVSAFQDAALGTTKETREKLTNEVLTKMIGKVVKVHIKARKEKDPQYGDTQVGSISGLQS